MYKGNVFQRAFHFSISTQFLSRIGSTVAIADAHISKIDLSHMCILCQITHVRINYMS